MQLSRRSNCSMITCKIRFFWVESSNTNSSDSQCMIYAWMFVDFPLSLFSLSILIFNLQPCTPQLPQNSGHSMLMCATQCLFVAPRNCKPFLISNFSSFGQKTNSNAHRWHSWNHDIHFSHKISNWLVVSNIFHVHPYLEKIPNLTVRIFFKGVGSKPPTRQIQAI